MPRSVFLGRIVAPGEPEWLPSDRQAALEWQLEQDLKCGDCGLPRDETMADERLVPLGLAPDYIAEKHRCRACEARESMARAAREDDETGDPGSGLKLIVREVRLNGQEVS